MYFSFFKPQDWRKRSVVRGRGFIQRFPRKNGADAARKGPLSGCVGSWKNTPMCGQSAVFSVITVS